MRNAVRDGLIPPPDPALVARFVAALEKQLSYLSRVSADARIGIAVSGGPDSLALLLLASAAFPEQIEAATVDHGLRPESAEEAEMVANVCARLRVRHETRRRSWNSEAREGLQAAARDYRYRELGSWCAERDLALLVTAHHADDQAETLLMRLSRGAGVRGLGSIRPVRWLRNVRTNAEGKREAWPVFLVRPLLGFAKRDLSAIVATAGLRPVDDPSNDSERFDRTRARRLLADAAWLDPARLAASASHLADADEALAWAAAREFDRRVEETLDDEETESGYDEWLLDPAGLPNEILRRVVELMLFKAEDYALPGYDGPPPTGPELTRFIARLQRGESATLWHVLARPGERWRFSVAPPRRT